jgi:hypothetical protein
VLEGDADEGRNGDIGRSGEEHAQRLSPYAFERRLY